MSLRNKRIKIEAGNPFANCKLNRHRYSEVLSNIVTTYSEGFVLAINNKWGTGKTTFVKMWEQELKDKGFLTINFNAWENDFENNPLIALMGELKVLTSIETELEYKATLKRAATFSKNIAPVIVQAIADKYIDTKGIKDAIASVTKGLAEVFEKEVNDYSNKKKSVAEFKESLSKFIAKTKRGKPIIFIIDELDRCRPDYAVSVLEQIKHFFSVPNIVFVLAIDKIQLGYAIKGVYGNDNIDSDEYLRRFIDIEYSIPEPDTDSYCNYLYELLGFDNFFNSNKRLKIQKLESDKKDFLDMIKFLIKNSSLTLRQQEKVFILCRLVLRTIPENYYAVPYFLSFLIFTKIIYFDFYSDLKGNKLTISQVQEKFLEIFLNNILEENEKALILLEAYLVNYYNNNLNSERKKTLIQKGQDGHSKLLISSVINKKMDNHLLRILEDINRGRNEGNLNLNYFINKIELMENFQFEEK
ncbi:KAP family P-loop NTPase fold protein [Flexithrix dorotheae]|uniref:KAP family P-loop NTPase fold protein n=1 Tax=Flexithrix dorotheae TaxID=70993 RepID=UPI00037A0A1B|nr:P-loop NTPase fold protein [Flexithrix dorotheae]